MKSFLENIAVGASQFPESTGGDTGSAMKGTNEVRQILESDLERERRDRHILFVKQASGSDPEPRSYQELMGTHPENRFEAAQEVKRTQACSSGRGG